MFKTLIKTIKKNIGIEGHNTTTNEQNNIPLANSYVVNDYPTLHNKSSSNILENKQPSAPPLNDSSYVNTTFQTCINIQPSAPPLDHSNLTNQKSIQNQSTKTLFDELSNLEPAYVKNILWMYKEKHPNDSDSLNKMCEVVQKINNRDMSLEPMSLTTNISYICDKCDFIDRVEMMTFVFHHAIKLSRKKDAIEVINKNILSIKDLKDVIEYLDDYNYGTPTNKTRPFIKKLLIEKINVMEKDL